MKSSLKIVFAMMLVFPHSVFGKVLKPDRQIFITSLENGENKTGKRYRVEAKTSGMEPTLYYKLSCGTGAADLEVGHTYEAAEVQEEGTKVLVIWHVNPEADSNVLGIGCAVESVKTDVSANR
jgi:hypothetical protein